MSFQEGTNESITQKGVFEL